MSFADTGLSKHRAMIDIDDTLCDMMNPVLGYLENQGLDIARDELKTFDDIQDHVDFDTFLEAVEKHFLHFNPYEHVVRSVNSMYRKGTHVVIATSRGYSDVGYQATAQWLAMHDIKHHELHIVDRCKADYFEDDDPFDVVFEDKAECVERMIDKDMIVDNVFLMDAPWNRYFDHDKVIRINPVNGWVLPRKVKKGESKGAYA